MRRVEKSELSDQNRNGCTAKVGNFPEGRVFGY